MKLAKLSHTKRNYILCASVSALLIIWNFVVIFVLALVPEWQFFAVTSMFILLVDVFCILRLSTKIAVLRHFPEEKHGKLAILTLALAFLPTIIWAVLRIV